MKYTNLANVLNIIHEMHSTNNIRIDSKHLSMNHVFVTWDIFTPQDIIRYFDILITSSSLFTFTLNYIFLYVQCQPQCNIWAFNSSNVAGVSIPYSVNAFKSTTNLKPICPEKWLEFKTQCHLRVHKKVFKRGQTNYGCKLPKTAVTTELLH